ncbi:30990_t:CDS:1, partial [Racocetra persica]
ASQFDCPSTVNSNEEPQTYIIQLSSKAATDKHYEMIQSCYDKHVGDASIQSDDPNYIKDISIGSFICYIGQFRPSDAAALASLPEVANVEPDLTYSVSYHIPIRGHNDQNHKCTSTNTPIETTKSPIETPIETIKTHKCTSTKAPTVIPTTTVEKTTVIRTTTKTTTTAI